MEWTWLIIPGFQTILTFQGQCLRRVKRLGRLSIMTFIYAVFEKIKPTNQGLILKKVIQYFPYTTK